jgi:glycerophosphoryl diester phosphodiesterase
MAMTNIKHKIVIAHRGASGYLPEHSLAAKALAFAMGADYLEQDLVMTADDRLVVLHDRFLDRVTDVAEIFPGRQRRDGRFHVKDFSLAEIRRLRMMERFMVKGGVRKAVFPRRFPVGASMFRVNTFEEEIEFAQGLSKSFGRQVGIYPEIKSPGYFFHEGKDIAKATLEVLRQYGYTKKEDPVYFQCFDPVELRRVRQELMPELGMDLELVQLMAYNDWREVNDYKNGCNVDVEWMLKPGAMAEIAEYADAIGPHYSMLVKGMSLALQAVPNHMVREAHQSGLEVHPFTFRKEQGEMPVYAGGSFDKFLDIFYNRIGVDGLFTDFPDLAVQFLKERGLRPSGQ